jgi:pimeloyl-ACP methyl ester carboxylesterase
VRPERFEIAIAQTELDELRARLERTRWPGDLANDSWEYGTNEVALRALVEAWSGYDWRATEARMNAYAHHRVELGGQEIHYLHVDGDGLPLLLLSGWPSTHWDFEQVLPALDGFQLVVPDLPGYGFSSPLRVAGLGYVQAAELFHELMTGVLGQTRYGVYGFDWGALVGEQIAHLHPEHVVGLHVSMPFPLDFAPIAQELWAEEEAPFAARTADWVQTGMGYFNLQATRPQTIAYLSDSPTATGAWIYEKLHAFSDDDGYPRHKALDTLSLYWLTSTIGSAARFYAESLRAPWRPAREGDPVVAVPTGVAAFPKENTQVPRAWCERYFDLRRYTRMERGGHFAAVEQPAALAAELRAFFGELA